MKHLVLSSNNLKMARNEDFEGALENVTSLNLANTQLLPLQLVSVLSALLEGGKIQELNLSLISLEGSEHAIVERVRDLVCRVIPKCRSVQLRSFPFMWAHEWKLLFTAFNNATTPLLEELDISKNHLSRYKVEESAASSAAALAAAVVKIVRVKIMEAKLTNLQSSSIFKRICGEGGRIQDLNIMFNNLSQLDEDYLAKAATRLVRLNLGWTKLNERQLERLFERLDAHKKKKGNLRELKLSGVDLSRLDQRLLARVMSRLEVVDLNFTRLREEQLTALLHRLKESCQLKDLTLSSNDLSQVRNCLRMLFTLIFMCIVMLAVTIQY